MRRMLVIAATLVAVVSLGYAVPSGAQTDTTTVPPNPGQLDALTITGSVRCTTTGNYEVTWTLENTSDRAIGFFDAYAALNANHSDPTRVDVQLGTIDPGASTTVMVTTAGTTKGQYVLQTEAYFVGEEPYAGPVPGVVTLDGTCVASTSSSVAPPTTAATKTATGPTYTG